MTVSKETLAIVAEATATGGAPDTLEALEGLNIEWHITDEGHLMVRTWQVGMENFVPSADVADLRARKTTPVPEEAASLEWVAAHLGELQRDHAGQWIAVDRNRVAASATNLGELMNMLEDLGAAEPLITQIPTGPIVWKAVYGHQIV